MSAQHHVTACLQMSTALQEQAQQLQATAARQLETMVSAHAAELSCLRDKLTNEHAANVSGLQATHQEALASLRQQLQQQMQQLQQQHQHEVQQLNAAATSNQSQGEAKLR